MAEPELADEPEDDESEFEPVDDFTPPDDVIEAQEALSDDEDGDPPDRDTVEVAEAALEDDDFEGGLFSGTEERREPDPDPADADDGETMDFDKYADSPEEAVAGLQGASSDTIENAINEGAARLFVAGLEEDEQDRLEGEFVDVFEAFRLGFFGARSVEEHVLKGEEDVDPLWGLAGSLVVCGVFAFHMRPDGEEQLANLKTRLKPDDDVGEGVSA